MMRRRDFIAGLVGGAAAMPLALPFAACAQQRMRRVGVLFNTDQGSSDGRARFAAFRGRLQELGWAEDRNIRIDVRWGGGDLGRTRAYAAELVALSPDALLAYASAQLAALSQATRSVPIVFIGVSDPVSPGFVASFARPGGHITGFTLYEPPMGGKWVALLKEVAPATTRVALMANPDTALLRGRLFAPALQSGARALGIEPVSADVRSVGDIETAIAALGQGRGGGFVVVPESFTSTHRELIVALAARHRVPAIYPFQQFTMSGGLMSYGPDNIDISRRSASYVDRILKGEKPSDLPVQAPTKYQLTINLKTAKALGLTVPPTVLAGADEVIE